MKLFNNFLLVMMCFFAIFSFVACDSLFGDKNPSDGAGNLPPVENPPAEEKPEDKIPAVYNGFFNYPIGRVDPTGMLTVQNQSASDVLLFNGSVSAENYLGTVTSLSSVILKMPEEKFYSIVAVEKSNYEEKAAQAGQVSFFTFYSNLMINKVNVSTTKSSGTGTWLISNPTSYWASFTSSDRSQNYAVIAPGALRVKVPIEINKNIDFLVFFTKEVTFNGRVVATVETTDTELYNTAVAKENNNYQFSTTIGSADLTPSTSLKPSILVRNNLTRGSVYVNKSTIQLTNGADTIDGGLAVIAGESQLYVGLEVGDKISTINFENNAWTAGGYGNLFVTEDYEMEAGKLYILTLTGSSSDTRAVSVEVVDADKYFEENK